MPPALSQVMTIIRENRWFTIDHAAKQSDRSRVNPNRASLRPATQCQTVASKKPSDAADFAEDAGDESPATRLRRDPNS